MSKIASATYDISIKSDLPTVTRNITFNSGEEISFKIFLPENDTDTISAMHRKSVERAIGMLQEWLNPQQQ